MDLTDTLVTRRQHIEAQLALICEVISRDFEYHRQQNIALGAGDPSGRAGRASVPHGFLSGRAWLRPRPRPACFDLVARVRGALCELSLP